MGSHNALFVPVGRKRVLVVEDEQHLASEIMAALQDYGFAVECVHTGYGGLVRARDGAFDVVVMDRMLPDIDGLSVLATLRNIGKHMPVLILSALAAVDERIRGLRAGGDDYVTKPFDSLELAARLTALLRQRDFPEMPSVLRVGDLTLDTQSQVVCRAGQTLDLKPREYQLLTFLMQHAGETVTRAMLFEAVWNYHFNAQSNVIDMHIGHLRRKVALSGRASLMIHTVRNVGYILQASESA